MTNKPVIVLTMGDPLGAGPEIAAEALYDDELRKTAVMKVAGDRRILYAAAEVRGLKDFQVKCGADITDVPCILPKGKHLFENGIPKDAGTVRDYAGKNAFDSICASHRLCISGEADAVATAPVNKEALRAAEVPFIGHTEIFGSLTETEDPLTMFETLGLRVFFLTRHVSLKKACEMVTKDRITDYVVRMTEALRTIGISPSKDCPIAIAGLNPHSGEHGLFGNEEQEAIVPAVEECVRRGYYVTGPVSADSVFYQARCGKYTAVLSLYHDQGHIATKTLDFERTISLTLGMPYLRTSVDHGTAFDIAWKGIASAVSMKEAVRLAAKYNFTGKI